MSVNDLKPLTDAFGNIGPSELYEKLNYEDYED